MPAGGHHSCGARDAARTDGCPPARVPRLVPDYCGIRPKLTGKGEPAADFLIDGPAGHGLPRLVHLFGIESPGLTSALSIAEDDVAQIS